MLVNLSRIYDRKALIQEVLSLSDINLKKSSFY
jgi:hypothetical protein